MSDQDFEKEMKELAEGGFPGAGKQEELSDEDDILSGFPGSIPSDSIEDELEEEVKFDGFGEESAEDEAAELLNGIDVEETDLENFEEEFETQEEDDHTDEDADPLAAFMDEDEDEHAVTDEDDETPFDEGDEFEEGEDEGGSKLQGLIMPVAGVSVIAILAAAGYFMFFSGGSAPVVANAPAPAPATYTPTNNQPPAIPLAQNQGTVGQVPALPSAVDNSAKVQIPGLAQDVTPEVARPNLGGQDEVVLANPTPSFEATPPAPKVIDLAPIITNDDPLAEPEKDTADLDQVIGKIDSVLAKFDEFEQKFVTKEDVSSLIAQEIKKIPAQAGGPSAVEVAELRGAVDELSERIAMLENTSYPSADELTRKQLSAVEQLIEKRFQSMEAKLTTQVEAPVAPAEPVVQPAPSKPAPAKVKSESAETKRLKDQVKAQQKQIAALKARGNAVNPPSKPAILRDYRLAGMSNDMVWIESEAGTSRFTVGQDIPGAGQIREVRQSSTNPAVITSRGIILP